MLGTIIQVARAARETNAKSSLLSLITRNGELFELFPILNTESYCSYIITGTICFLCACFESLRGCIILIIILDRVMFTINVADLTVVMISSVSV